MKPCCGNCVHSDKMAPPVGIKIPCRLQQMLVQPRMKCESWSNPNIVTEENRIKEFQKIEELLKKFNKKYGTDYKIG